MYAQIVGFSGFGFPKAHSAAFGLLAYQSTWLRVHYGPEFLCALLNEQPMGFYPPDTLVHEAQRRGIEVLAPDVRSARALECTVEPSLGVRIGLGYVAGVRVDDVRGLVAERERGGEFGSVAELAARCAAQRDALERLAWAGACDSLVVERGARTARGGRRCGCSASRRPARRVPGRHAARAAARAGRSAGARRPDAVGAAARRLRLDARSRCASTRSS